MNGRITTQVDKLSSHAAQLAVVEIGIGSVAHALKLPFGGQLLSLNQGAVLSHISGDESLPAATSAMTVSTLVAILKSLSPAGNKLGPMLSIAMQGFLFASGVFVFGTNPVGVAIGMILLSFWAFIQPFVTLYLFFGHDIFQATTFYLQKMRDAFGLEPETIVFALGMIILVKGFAAAIIGLFFYLRPQNTQGYFQGLLKFKNRSINNFKRDRSAPLSSIILLSFKDMLRPLFIFSFGFMFIFFYFAESEISNVIWLSLRPLAIAFIFFFISRHPFFYGFIGQLKKRQIGGQFFDALERTVNKLEKMQFDEKM